MKVSHFTLQQQIFLAIYKYTLETTLYSKYNFTINKPFVCVVWITCFNVWSTNQGLKQSLLYLNWAVRRAQPWDWPGSVCGGELVAGAQAVVRRAAVQRQDLQQLTGTRTRPVPQQCKAHTHTVLDTSDTLLHTLHISHKLCGGQYSAITKLTIKGPQNLRAEWICTMDGTAVG